MKYDARHQKYDMFKKKKKKKIYIYIETQTNTQHLEYSVIIMIIM